MTDSPHALHVRMNTRVSGWASNSVLLGGSPWRMIRIAEPARKLVDQLFAAGPLGVLLTDSSHIAIARELLDRGFLTPVPQRMGSEFAPDVVVPVFNASRDLEVLLKSLGEANVIVVDDGSTNQNEVANVARLTGAEVIRHTRNLGPARARNSGLSRTRTPVAAFIDADCVASSHWHTDLMFHFDDPRLAAVAPRIQPTPDQGSILERFERTRSALDMGPHAGLVQPGARPAFVPTAALLVRRSALADPAFDPDLRLGEDVDLIWRLTESGWLVRYDPGVVVQHRTRVNFFQWIRRRFEYGTSAADLEDRHPGKLTPLRPSPWNIATLLLIAAGRPFAAAGVALGATTLLWRRLPELSGSSALAARLVAQGVIADSAAVGHLLRREWWPLGIVALLASPRSRFARCASVSILGPIAWEWSTTRTHLDPISYAALRLIEDAAYGSGVIMSSVRSRKWATLIPRFSGRRH